MQQTKSEYIDESIKEYATQKIDSNSNGLFLVAAYFLYLSSTCFYSFYNICTIFIFITILCIGARKLFAQFFLKYRSKIFYFKLANYFIVITSLFWSFATHLIINSPLISDVALMTIFFAIGAMVTFAPTNLSHNNYILSSFIILLILPLFNYIYSHYPIQNPFFFQWIIIFICFIFFHFYNHASITRKQLVKSFCDNYDLKKSYVELENKSQLLEEETLKTFHVTRLSSLGEMAGSIAHEINNPLMVITGSINLLKKNEAFNGNDDLKCKFDKIKKASSRIADIVTSMKMVASKHDNVAMESVDLNQLIKQILVLYEDKFKIEDIKLQFFAPKDNISVKANPVQVSQILLNLISNAFDEVIKYKKRIIEIEIIENQFDVNVLVKNTGDIIPEDVQQKMFEPFYTTKPLNKGTGLGLSISRSLAKENNGFLEYSPLKDMVCFRLNLTKA